MSKDKRPVSELIKNRIITCSRNKASNIINSPRKSPYLRAVISIGCPDYSKPPYRLSKIKVPVLRLLFDDIEFTSSYYLTPPTKEDVEAIISFGEKVLTNFKEDEFILSHCAMGISRSTAAAYILRCILLGPGKEQEALDALRAENEKAFPNLLMVRYADDLLARDGAMCKAVDTLNNFPNPWGEELWYLDC